MRYSAKSGWYRRSKCGIFVGNRVGFLEGFKVGLIVGCVGLAVGVTEGSFVGFMVGVLVVATRDLAEFLKALLPLKFC